MASAWLWLLCLSATQALTELQSVELRVEVPENYGGNFPLYLLKLPLPRMKAEAQLVLSGNVDTNGTFAVDPDTDFLLVTRPLDREQQAEYLLQVNLESEDGHVLWGPQLVLVRVKDENDQVPRFSQAIYRVQLSQDTRPGVPFFFLEASDGDEPGTVNSDLRFHILNQAPALPFPDVFQLEPQLGALSLKPKGSSHQDHALEGAYELLVQVKDMGDQASGYQATAVIDVSVVENTWVPLDPVQVVEHLQVQYPHLIAQVRWSGGEVHYHLESQPHGPFDVDTEGRLSVTAELDREAQAEYLLQVRAQNFHGEDYAEPLELRVVVMDENDNAPVCPPQGPIISIPEQSPHGTAVLTLSAYDEDDPHSPNSHIVYQLLRPEAEKRVLELDSTSGRVTVGTAPLVAGHNLLLQVLATDLGGAEGGLSSTCEVTVMVLDINDHAPQFTSSQVEPVSLREDTEPGTLVATLTATDADLEPSFRFMDFAIEAGNAEGIFGLDWEPYSGQVHLQLLKKLSYEAAPSHELVVVVRNVAELVGPEPGPESTATVTVLVKRVVPAPKLDQQLYEASIPISIPAGSLLMTIQPSEPPSSPLSFSLVNDTEGWFYIEEVSGKVHTAQPLQDAHPGDTYTVLIKVQVADEPALSTSATLMIKFLKAFLAPDPSLAPVPTRHLCTPRQDHGVIVSGPNEDLGVAGDQGPYSFALGPNPTVQRDWRLQALNGSHAYLSLALHWVEPGEHTIPVVVSHNTQTWQLQVQVIVCRCYVDGQCLRKAGRMRGMPTKLSAVGTVVGTLVVIGFLLIFIFAHLSLARKKNLDQPVDNMPL